LSSYKNRADLNFCPSSNLLREMVKDFFAPDNNFSHGFKMFF